MATRGRPPILKDRKTTTVSIEGKQFEFILKKGIDLSKLVRDTIDLLMQEEETPIEQMERIKGEKLQQKQGIEVEIRQLDIMIQEAKEALEMEEAQGKILDELEEKRHIHFKQYEKNVRRNDTCKKMWLDHLIDGLKFATYEEAKSYAMDFWISDGLDENTVKAFLRLN